MAEHQYPLDNAWVAARERLGLIETIWDPWTVRNLEKLDVAPGWHCLELAGGGGSVAAWLCERVGSAGHVVATDIEPRFLRAIEASNLDVRRHNIVTDELPKAAFDLVHTRALLTFLSNPEEVLRKMAAAVKPGGWLLVEEPDYISAIPDPAMSPDAIEISQKGWGAILSYLTSHGYDTKLGRRLYSAVHSARLADVGCEGLMTMQLGGAPSARFWRVTLEQIRDGVTQACLLTDEELEAYAALLGSPEYRWLQPVMVSAWGRRPAEPGAE